jgi:hypothetical protein
MKTLDFAAENMRRKLGREVRAPLKVPRTPVQKIMLRAKLLTLKRDAARRMGP